MTSTFRTMTFVAIAAAAAMPARSAASPQTLGSVALYPGAHPRPERGSQPDHRATLTLAGVHVGRAAAETYQTDASADAVLSFYRRELQRFGAVTECRGGENRAASVRLDDSSLHDVAVCHPAEFGEGDTELKAERAGELAVVTVRSAGTACEFAVVDVQASDKS